MFLSLFTLSYLSLSLSSLSSLSLSLSLYSRSFSAVRSPDSRSSVYSPRVSSVQCFIAADFGGNLNLGQLGELGFGILHHLHVFVWPKKRDMRIG